MNSICKRWVLECCLLHDGGSTREQMKELGAPDELIELGIKLHEYLESKNLGVEQDG